MDRTNDTMTRKPTHPGAILRFDYLEPLALSVTGLTAYLGVSRKHLSAVVNERAGVSVDLALVLGLSFGWMRFIEKGEEGNGGITMAMPIKPTPRLDAKQSETFLSNMERDRELPSGPKASAAKLAGVRAKIRAKRKLAAGE